MRFGESVDASEVNEDLDARGVLPDCSDCQMAPTACSKACRNRPRANTRENVDLVAVVNNDDFPVAIETDDLVARDTAKETRQGGATHDKCWDPNNPCPQQRLQEKRTV